ncbi:zinc finger protein 501-like isoform X2 [Lepisosteus oculatus]|uniref:zinc finger protein 501-like isoform X2 n=1 Tax=Lepisosteus oculatus TaxID=7918 RepID=UPI0007404CE1|nr:PREDICTED: zinc finger protein 691-like isoform X2 [Lepisosteus oculatus]
MAAKVKREEEEFPVSGRDGDLLVRRCDVTVKTEYAPRFDDVATQYPWAQEGRSDVLALKLEVGDDGPAVWPETPEPPEVTVEIESNWDSDSPTDFPSRRIQKKPSRRAARRRPIPKVYHCDVCDKDIKHLLGFQEHQRIHTGERPYECPQCHKRFTRCADLIKHRLVHSDRRPYPCPTCGKCFKLQGDVTKHQAVHSAAEPFRCAACGKAFKRAACLVKHERVHAQDSPFRCPTCGRGFKWEASLTEHVRTHTGERPFRCGEEGCGKSFAHRSTFLQHGRTHRNQRQFRCPRCPRGFNHRSNLVKHERTHREPGGRWGGETSDSESRRGGQEDRAV